jgi:murein DD-endopeptidase MepM/ murein hydrolase activator NlpD
MINPLDQIQTIANADKSAPTQAAQDAMRKAAMQFEAVLLQQLTASLNGTTNDDGGEDSLYGGDGGTDLAKKMFSEQLATTMAESGGIGLSDLIMQKFGVTQKKPVSNNIKSLSGAISAVKDINRIAPTPKQNLPTRYENISTKKQDVSIQNNVSSVTRQYLATPVNRPAKPEPVTKSANKFNDVEIISTYEDDLKQDAIEESLKPLVIDGKIVNSTRPRIIPDAPVTKISDVLPVTETAPLLNSPKISFQMPVNGRISSGFGNRFHPIDKKIKFHDGIDIAVPVGTKVVAAADGVVKFAGWKGGYGNVVVIAHADGSETLYGHNSKLLVAEGQKVIAGQPISLSGSTGKSTGPHVHFEVRRNGQLVNPIKVLSNVLSKDAER